MMKMTSETARRIAGYTVLLSIASAATASELPDGMILRYTFDKAESGGAIPNQAGSQHVGRATGARWTTQGRAGGAYDFGPTNTYIMVTNAPALNPKQASFALWFRSMIVHPNGQALIDKHPERGYGLAIGGGPTNGPHHGRLMFTVNGKTCVSDDVVVDGAWYHAAAIADGKTLRIYIDGKPQKQVVPLEAEIQSNDRYLYLGLNRSSTATNAPIRALEGAIDNLTIFNRALSAAEVTNVWVYGLPKFTESQVKRRLTEIQELYDRGLMTREFYNRRVKECQVLPEPVAAAPAK